MDVPAPNEIIRLLAVFVVIVLFCWPCVQPIIRSFMPVHKWRWRNPHSRQCTRCGFRQDIYADEYGEGYDADGHQLVSYRGEHWVPDAPKVCNDERV
jgi:hypothetical protein